MSRGLQRVLARDAAPPAITVAKVSDVGRPGALVEIEAVAAVRRRPKLDGYDQAEGVILRPALTASAVSPGGTLNGTCVALRRDFAEGGEG